MLSWVLLEIVLNALEKPSTSSAGIVIGQELPPRKIIPSVAIPGPEERLRRAGEWHKPLVVSGRKITYGDLYGIPREDELLGHAPLENATSENGWWQSNQLGARSRMPTALGRSPMKERLLLFGDSYTQGSRVPQEETFAHYLDEELSRIDVINFGVDGYSMGQSFLRYEKLRTRLEHDQVLLVLVPEADLWREINVIRYIARGWESYKVNPRFVIEDKALELVKSPYRDLGEMLDENRAGVTVELRRHLQQHDRFYFESRFADYPFLDRSITFRLIRRWRAKSEYSELMNGLMDPSSEAMRVTELIALNMARVAESDGVRFTLVILPSPPDASRYVRESEYRDRWRKMSSFLCARLSACHDLMDDFARIPTYKFDSGYDGTHYGPSANSQIASLLIDKIS
ncbi:MAG: hypothetical protein JSW21_07385 [Gammaproteobacteria bacterium]|nr:MAG: hypothetical protein JSW21_07385 [Gammaproteobacteria bacterium]